MRRQASFLAAALLAAPVMAATQALLPPARGDLVPATLVAPPRPAPALRAPAIPPPHVERRPVSVDWPLPHDRKLDAVPQPFARPSRSYWRDVSASELRQGVVLPLTAAGALIRVSPSDPRGGALRAGQLRLTLAGRTMTGEQAASLVGDAGSLRASGMAVPEASVILRLKPALGAGMATLQAPTASGRYVVHVFEPDSPLRLTARADRATLLLGEHAQVRVTLRDGDRPLALQAAGGYLRAPDGRTTPLTYRRQPDGSYTADVQPGRIPATPGLWEVHSFTEATAANGLEVRRDTTTVFAAAAPDARLDGSASVRRRLGRVDLSLGVQVAGASRYAVSGVLYGHDAAGGLVPAAYAQSAAWLKAGTRQLTLHYDRASLAGVRPPYELRDLRLQDQPAVSLLERRAVALRFGP